MANCVSQIFNAPNLSAHWTVPPSVIGPLFCTLLFVPDIDLFSSELNHCLPRFCRYHLCKGVFRVDCFILDLSKFNGYVFAPPVLILKILHKIFMKKITKICRLWPIWKGAEWWPMFLQMIEGEPTLLPKSAVWKLYLLWDQFRELRHLFTRNLRILFMHLSHLPSVCPICLQGQTQHIAQYKLRDATVKKHNVAAQEWFIFCKAHETSLTDFSFETCMAFLEHYAFREHCTFSKISRHHQLVTIGRKLVGNAFTESKMAYMKMFTEACVCVSDPPRHQSLLGTSTSSCHILSQKERTNCSR